MQRSLINEFKGGSSSGIFQSTVLGTNSLLQRHKEGDLYKSRIAHLPNDTRIDLSRRLDFVVVFQSIEIERLGAQLQFLRGRIREREGAGLHQASYEVQIRELMERCSKLESEKYSYRQELWQTKAASESIFHELSILQGRYSQVDFCAAQKYKLEKARGEELVVEIEKWKGRYAALERTRAQEQESMRRVMESQREAVGSREAKDLLGRFELEKEELLAKLRERKEQLDERELELKKLQNCYEQLQVRSRQDEAKIDSYEQKVAMLSQQTFRLSEMLRAKTEQIRSLKMMGEQDFSMKMSQIHSLDETNHHLNDRLRLLEDQNDQLREEGRAMGEQLAHLKRKLAEVERLELQVREAKEDSESKLRAMERKDKRIFALEEEVRQGKRLDEEVKRLKAANLKMQADLQQLQERLDAKIEELRMMKEQQSVFISWREQFTVKLQSKMGDFTSAIQSLQRENTDIRSVSEQNMERSAAYELKAKEFAIQLKQKDYHIASLHNQLKQQEAKAKTREVESTTALQQLQSHLFAQRRNFEERLQQAQARWRDGQQYIRQAQSKCKELQRRVKQAEQRAKGSQSNQMRMRNLQVQCNQLESWGRSLQNKNRQLQLHIAQLDTHLLQMDEERAQLRAAIESQAHFYQEVEQRYFQNGQDIKSIRSRLDNIEKILITLKTTVGLRLKGAQDENRRLQSIESRYDQLYQWFVSVSSNFESGLRDSPTKQPYHSIFATNDSSRYSTSLDRSSLSPLHRARSSQRTRENINSANNLPQQEPSLPLEMALRHVLLCVEVESLRKRVGDKNAKVQSMRNSAIRTHPAPSGFFTGREPSAGKTIYY